MTLPADDYAAPAKRAQRIHDASAVCFAWDHVHATKGLTPDEPVSVGVQAFGGDDCLREQIWLAESGRGQAILEMLQELTGKTAQERLQAKTTLSAFLSNLQQLLINDVPSRCRKIE